ncbi:MAG TPA: aminoglycoside adenylyltransferase domain-containing protein [Roseiflexaceae bacterium]|nr:aminoglycoside adenylyltransferase domain-containing protein [Roseiflexaceae bacterium]
MNPLYPTSHRDVNALLDTLLPRVQLIVGDQFVGMYLDGSLANGDFDQASDIDFVVVTTDEITSDLFLALQAMHDQIATSESRFAVDLEGSYIPRAALRRYDPAHAVHPNIERGAGERLKLVHHDTAWLVHLHILRERGITLAGPPARSLIDPIAPADLRQAMLSVLAGWAARILDQPARIATHRGSQSYIVLSLCRVLYTLDSGAVVSKQAAANWAKESLDARWVPLIERALAGRHDPTSAVPPEDIDETLEFVRYSLERSQQYTALDKN